MLSFVLLVCAWCRACSRSPLTYKYADKLFLWCWLFDHHLKAWSVPFMAMSQNVLLMATVYGFAPKCDVQTLKYRPHLLSSAPWSVENVFGGQCFIYQSQILYETEQLLGKTVCAAPNLQYVSYWDLWLQWPHPSSSPPAVYMHMLHTLLIFYHPM